MKDSIFWIFGVLQALTLGIIIFLILPAGTDTKMVLSVLFPVFTLLVEYMIYEKR